MGDYDNEVEVTAGTGFYRTTTRWVRMADVVQLPSIFELEDEEGDKRVKGKPDIQVGEQLGLIRGGRRSMMGRFSVALPLQIQIRGYKESNVATLPSLPFSIRKVG